MDTTNSCWNTFLIQLQFKLRFYFVFIVFCEPHMPFVSHGCRYLNVNPTRLELVCKMLKILAGFAWYFVLFFFGFVGLFFFFSWLTSETSRRHSLARFVFALCSQRSTQVSGNLNAKSSTRKERKRLEKWEGERMRERGEELKPWSTRRVAESRSFKIYVPFVWE